MDSRTASPRKPSGRRYFFANPRLREQYAHKEAHKVEAERGKITGFRSLPRRKGIRKKGLT